MSTAQPELPAHSPVGMSGISRYLPCPGSVTASVGIEDEESDHAALGTAVHEMIEKGFTANLAGWQMIGQVFNGIMATKEMANGAQVMLDAVRGFHPDRNQGNFCAERKFHCPSIHPLFFGTCDALYLDESGADWLQWVTSGRASVGALALALGEPGGCLECLTEASLGPMIVMHVWDYKNGAGVVVEVEDNGQTKGYACGAMEDLKMWDRVDLVVLHIVQPNAFHPDGRHRTWALTPDELVEWLEDTLVPGIDKALTSREFNSGSHCRFCPVRARACPALVKDMEELRNMIDHVEKVGIDAVTNEWLGRFGELSERFKIVEAAASKTTFHRLNAGVKVPGFKLVKKSGWRAWKDGADKKAVEIFGERAMSEPKLKSPAEIDELPLGTTFTTEWAQKPDNGLTVAKESDKRAAVNVDTKSLFQPVQTPSRVDAEPAPITGTSKRRGKPSEGVAA